MAQSKAFTDASHALNDLSHALALLEAENAKLHELCKDMLDCIEIRTALGRPPTSEMYERFVDAARELGIEASK